MGMCCNRICNNRINHLDERPQRIENNDNGSSFEDLLQRDQSASIGHRNSTKPVFLITL